MTVQQSIRGFSERASRLDKALGVLALASISVLPLSISLNIVDARSQRAYAPGDHLNVPALHIEKSPKTLVLWLDTNCHFCSESMPFYRRLAEGRRIARMVVVGRQPRGVLLEYMNQQGVRVDGVTSVSEQETRFRGTPELALVRSDGLVQKVWLGKLRSPEDEAAVIDSVK